MVPVLGREVVEGEQRLAILDRAFDGLAVFDAQVSTKAPNAARASFLVSAFQISCVVRLALGCWLFGSLSSASPDVALPMTGSGQNR
jgi:hypothetical protein